MVPLHHAPLGAAHPASTTHAGLLKAFYKGGLMKFEYERQLIDTDYLDLNKLNELGKQGWEAISTTLIRKKTIYVLLKRSIPEDGN